MSGIGIYTELLLNERDDVIQKHYGECVVAGTTATLLLLGLRLRSILTFKMDILALAVIHYNDERNSLLLGNQVIHDLTGVTLNRPAVLVLGVTVLQIQYRILLVRVLVILVGQIYIAVTHALGGL